MRTKDEIERSLAEMKRMAYDARRGMAKAKEMNATVLVKHFEQWETKCEARAQILSWVLGQELNEDVQPQLPQAHVTSSALLGINCTAKGCTEAAVHDYNGHGDYACEYHLRKWEQEFEDDYS